MAKKVKKSRGRPPKPTEKIPDTFDNVIKPLVSPRAAPPLKSDGEEEQVRKGEPSPDETARQFKQ